MEILIAVLFALVAIAFILIGFVHAKIQITLQQTYCEAKFAIERSDYAMKTALEAISIAKAVERAPVLRQYVEKYVARQETDEKTQEELEKNMDKAATEWNKVFGFPTQSPVTPRAPQKDTFDPEKLV